MGITILEAFPDEADQIRKDVEFCRISIPICIESRREGRVMFGGFRAPGIGSIAALRKRIAELDADNKQLQDSEEELNGLSAAQNDAIVAQGKQLDRLEERLGNLREISRCPPDMDLETWCRWLLAAFDKHNESLSQDSAVDQVAASNNRPFPIQDEGIGGNWGRQTACTIPWWLAEEAYLTYSRKHGTDQTLEKLAERGGFGRGELLGLLCEV